MQAAAEKIHPTALIHPGAQLANGVEAGPCSVVGEFVSIGENTVIGAHCVIDGDTTIGKNCRIFTGAVIGSIPQDLKYKGEKTVCSIGDNNRIREYVTINLGTVASGKTVIGNDNLLMAYAHVAHDCVVGNGTIIANNGTLGGHVVIEDRAIVGGLTGIHQFVRVGCNSIIGGCSKVLKDVPPYCTADGHPARVYGLNTVGLKRCGFPDATRVKLKEAFKVLFNSGLTVSQAILELEKEKPLLPEVLHLIEFIKSSERGICLRE